MVTEASVVLNPSNEPLSFPFSPIPHIVWRKVDATDLPANHEISESGAVLHLYNVQYEDVGGYECEAINTKGKDWHKAWLYVECEFAYCAAVATCASKWQMLVSIVRLLFQLLPSGPRPSTTLRRTSAPLTPCAAWRPGSRSRSSAGTRTDIW